MKHVPEAESGAIGVRLQALKAKIAQLQGVKFKPAGSLSSPLSGNKENMS